MRVLIADDAPAVRSALLLALSGRDDVQVVGEAAEWAALLALARTARPDVVLLDWGLPGNEDGAALRALRLACPGVRVAALSARPDDRQPALRAGAEAFVSKADHPDRLHAALHALAHGHAPAEA